MILQTATAAYQPVALALGAAVVVERVVERAKNGIPNRRMQPEDAAAAPVAKDS